MPTSTETAEQIAAEIDALPQRTTATVRKVRREHSRALRTEDATLIIEVARALLARDKRNGRSGLRWVAYELIRNHKPAFESLDDALLEELGRGMHSWDTVDDFSRTLSGPAWLPRNGIRRYDTALGEVGRSLVAACRACQHDRS